MIKQTLIKTLPIIMIICLVSFGIGILTLSNNATFLIYNQEFNYYYYDFTGYMNNLTINKWENIARWFESANLKMGETPSELITGIIYIINILIYGLNVICCLPLNIIGIILNYALSILGINLTNNSFWLTQFVNGIINLHIPFI